MPGVRAAHPRGPAPDRAGAGAQLRPVGADDDLSANGVSGAGRLLVSPARGGGGYRDDLKRPVINGRREKANPIKGRAGLSPRERALVRRSIRLRA